MDKFEAIAKRVAEEFAKFGVIDPDWFEDLKEHQVVWAWTNKLGENEYLTLLYDEEEGYATFEETFDDGIIGDVGDLNLDDVEGTANMLIQKFIYDEEYGGIGCKEND